MFSEHRTFQNFKYSLWLSFVCTIAFLIYKSINFTVFFQFRIWVNRFALSFESKIKLFGDQKSGTNFYVLTSFHCYFKYFKIYILQFITVFGKWRYFLAPPCNHCKLHHCVVLSCYWHLGGAFSSNVVNFNFRKF